ncbi:MAG: esterase-like activity of phytase family protein [Armatimonadaceae bacterium]
MSKRQWISAALAGMAAGTLAFLPTSAHAQRFNAVSFLGQAIIPTGTTFAGSQIGGLSGIDYDAANNRYFINSDAPTDPRFFTATLDIDGGAFTAADVTFTGVTALTGAGGTALAANTFDLEAIRYIADSNTVLIADEGNTTLGIAPSIREFNAANGQQVRQITAPSKFDPTATTGSYFNLSFESLALTNGGGTILTGTENALRQDAGNAINPSLTSQFARLVAFNSATGAAGAEYAYQVDAVVEPPAGNLFAVQGLVELLSLGGDDYISIERSFTVGGTSTGTGYAIRLYQFSLTGATDISGIDPLTGTFTPVQKSLLFDLGALGIPLDNIEGITLGPTLDDGRRTLVLVADNNFNSPLGNQFIVLAESNAPEPGAGILLVLGLAGMGGIALRRRNRK